MRRVFALWRGLHLLALAAGRKGSTISKRGGGLKNILTRLVFIEVSEVSGVQVNSHAGLGLIPLFFGEVSGVSVEAGEFRIKTASSPYGVCADSYQSNSK